MSEAKTTTDHKTIRAWAEARGGKPATVKHTEHEGEAGVLRIDFPGYGGQGTLEEISWDEFFAKFDEKNLAFLYQDETSSGEESRFFKLVSRDTVEQKSTHSTEHAHSAATHKGGKADDKKAHKAEKKDDKKAHDSKSDAKAHKASDHKKR